MLLFANHILDSGKALEILNLAGIDSDRADRPQYHGLATNSLNLLHKKKQPPTVPWSPQK